ncbi:MAG TPA: sigma 54-interacting transcriptional regulator [Candidatus Angelobacter sp.]|nr:sigma 54-interacting transcriptional regulator [Candidatus Angelobacter sp.]
MPAAYGQNSSSISQVGNGTGNLIVRSESLKRVLKLAEKVARHPAAVLIVGETGTGKEMIAHHIHNCSLRSRGPLIDVNCAAIPEHLVESELFGYEKGAFSGADSTKPGFFELADRGTLFLDEIGDLDMKVQVKLLRVLDGAAYYRLGGSKKVSIDVRVVAATNRDLEEMAAQGKFRDDLYHRLAQFRLDVPPLRDRPEDVIGIAEQVLHEHYPESVFAQEAVDALLGHHWRGNIRELRNVVFRAVLQGQNPEEEITAEDLQIPGPEREKAVVKAGNLDGMERQMIFQSLEKHGGNQGKAADALGISRRTLLRKLKVYRQEEEKLPAGTLSLSQQRYYRADVELPVMLKYANEQFEGVLLNLSLGGAGIRTDRALKFGAPVSLCFAIPGTNSAADIPGRVAWTQKEGNHGIQFAEMPSSLRATLQRWLQSEMKKDGWELGTTG